MQNVFAVFAVLETPQGFAATTRAADKGEAGRIGLPGGKVDPGETPREALAREAREEGWDIPLASISLTPCQVVERDGKVFHWYTATSGTMLQDYKEKGRISPLTVSREAILTSGYSNHSLKI